MTRILKLSALASLVATTAVSAAPEPTTNLLQSVSVDLTVYTQGTPVINGAGTNNVVDSHGFSTKALVEAVSSNYVNGQMLVRATPIMTTIVLETNLVAVSNSTITLVITNLSDSLNGVTNEIIFNGGAPTLIGDTNVTFGTNTETIGSNTVTLDTNIATAGTNMYIVGTNTTVTATTLTDSNGYNVGTNYVFVSYTITNVPTTTNLLGTPAWDIYTPATRHVAASLTPISTNVIFSISTDKVHGDSSTNALIHGETVGKNEIIKYGTTDEIRSFVLSNATWDIKLDGFAHGHYVPVEIGRNQVGYSQDLNWTGSGSGLSNSTPAVINGTVTETYFKPFVVAP